MRSLTILICFRSPELRRKTKHWVFWLISVLNFPSENFLSLASAVKSTGMIMFLNRGLISFRLANSWGKPLSTTTNLTCTPAHKLVFGDIFSECCAYHIGVIRTNDVELTPVEIKSNAERKQSKRKVDSAHVDESTPLSTKPPKLAYPTSSEVAIQVAQPTAEWHSFFHSIFINFLKIQF